MMNGALKLAFRVVWTGVKWGVPVVLVLVLLLVGRVVWRMRSALPDYNATVASPVVEREVRVIRDSWGVPHILADSETDAYFALGYCMAQDRLFQMELLRRLARGELAELLGPPVVKVDRIMRAFLLGAKAEEWAATAAERISPDMRVAMEAFVLGVNQYIEEQPLPWEFAALMISCRPFTIADCIIAAGILPISFADGLRTDPLKSLLMEQCPDCDMEALFRGIEEVPVTIMESLEEAAAFQRERANTGALSSRTRYGLESAARWLDALAAYGQVAGRQLGSNSWVLSGDKTASGKPILANDPHIAFTNPSVWYEAHLKYGDFENYGYHLPPIPIPLLGHNEDRGWGITMYCNDDVDLYLEKFHPDNPNLVMHKGEWVECRVVREEIKVRWGRDVVCAVRLTPHGPIAGDLFSFLFDYEGPPIALSWVWQHVEYTDFEAFYEMSHARDYDGFARAIRKITSPGLNISYADAQGNIAWWAAGLLAMRPAHVDSKTLLEGWTGRDDIKAFLPFEATPHLKNPDDGMIVTANNLTTVKPVGEPPLQIPFLQGYFKPGDRAGRIKEMLRERDDWTIEDLRAVQTDDMAYAPRHMAPAMTRLAREQWDALNALEREALNQIEAWDFRHPVDSIGATVFRHWLDSLLIHVLGDVLTPSQLDIYNASDDSWIAMQELLADLESTWWNNTTTERRESASEIVAQSLRHACEHMASRLGSDIEQWRWGRVHKITFTHPFGYLPGLGRWLNIGPMPVPGANHVVNNMVSKSLHSYDVIAGPSTRRLIDFSQPDQSLTILPTGNSGHLRSPHYDDQAEMFVRGEYRQALYDWKDIEADAAYEMRFLPATPRR